MFKLMRNGLPFSIVSDCVFNSAYIELNFPQDQISDVCLASHLAHMAVSAPPWQKNPFCRYFGVCFFLETHYKY